MNDWISPIGLELTWLPAEFAHRHSYHAVDYPRHYDYCSEEEYQEAYTKDHFFRKIDNDILNKAVTDFCERVGKSKIKSSLKRAIGHIHLDIPAIELSSGILRSKEQTKKLWDFVDPITKELGFIKNSEFQNGGAGHIHVNAVNRQHLVSTLLHFNLQPYITWAFGYATDNEWQRNVVTMTASVMGFESEIAFSPLHDLINCVKDSSIELKTLQSFQELFVTKGCGLRVVPKDTWEYKNPTHRLEFRSFSAAETWQEQEEHIDFVQAYLKYTFKHKPCTDLTRFKNKLPSKWFTCKQACAEFEMLIKTIGLDWDRYYPYLGMIEARYKMGKAYLT